MASPVWVEYVGNVFSVVTKPRVVLDVIDARCNQPQINPESFDDGLAMAWRWPGDRSAIGWPIC